MLLAARRPLLVHQFNRVQLLQRNPCLSTGTGISRNSHTAKATTAVAYRMAASDAPAPVPAATVALNKTAHQFARDTFEELMRSRFFYTQAFEIYGGAR